MGRGVSLGVGVLASDRQDGLRNTAAVFGNGGITKRAILQLSPWHRRFDLQLDHFRSECDGIDFGRIA